MKKLLIIAALLASNYAVAQDTTRLCASVAEAALNTARLAKVGMPYDEFEVFYLKNMKQTSVDGMEPIMRAMFSVHQETFMAWATLDPATIRSLAFTTCTVKVAQASR